MDITVKMTAEEFLEFTEWVKDNRKYEKELLNGREKLHLIAKQIKWAVEPDPKKPAKYKIADQDHMADLYEWAEDMLS